jgi:hypothetical protein
MKTIKRVGLAAAMAVVTVNVWTGAPLLALWVGSRVQSHSQASMAGIAVVAIVLAIVCFLLLRVLRMLGAQYDSLVGAAPTVRRHVTWLRSMRGERPEYKGVTAEVTMAERIAIVAVVLAVVLFEVWFFFFSTSPIDQRSGRGSVPLARVTPPPAARAPRPDGGSATRWQARPAGPSDRSRSER